MTQIKKILYEAVNQPVLSQVPTSAKRILDIGCGSGALAREIKHNIQCKIVGVTYSEQEASLGSKWFDQIFVEDINSFCFNSLGKFDCIICSHILEHLYQPQNVLMQLRNNLNSDGVLIVALPNSLHWAQRLKFLQGKFEYTEGGLMDKTHFRFFDWNTSLALVRGAGFKVISRQSDGHFPIPLVRNLIYPIASKIDKFTTKILPGLFGIQFIIVAQDCQKIS